MTDKGYTFGFTGKESSDSETTKEDDETCDHHVCWIKYH